MTKKTVIISGMTALLLGGAAALWHTRAPSERGRERQQVAPRIVTTARDSHRPADTYSKRGDTLALLPPPALAEALSHTSRLPYAQRLAAVHAAGRTLAERPLTPAQAASLRAFVAAPAIPEGLSIQQVRALKNDVLNVLCVQSGGEATTAAMLRALHADESADPGLRDYALQHLVTLSERQPSLGWSTHWAAIDGADTALAATALIHLSLRDRQGELTPAERTNLAAAALRLAGDATAKDPARTTAIQVCAQLKLTAARPLAHDLARSDQASMPLRIAAVATLGDLGGDAATHAYLTTLTTGSEKRLRVPAQSALQRLSVN